MKISGWHNTVFYNTWTNNTSKIGIIKALMLSSLLNATLRDFVSSMVEISYSFYQSYFHKNLFGMGNQKKLKEIHRI
jgi:hypothetical protein